MKTVKMTKNDVQIAVNLIKNGMDKQQVARAYGYKQFKTMNGMAMKQYGVSLRNSIKYGQLTPPRPDRAKRKMTEEFIAEIVDELIKTTDKEDVALKHGYKNYASMYDTVRSITGESLVQMVQKEKEKRENQEKVQTPTAQEVFGEQNLRKPQMTFEEWKREISKKLYELAALFAEF